MYYTNASSLEIVYYTTQCLNFIKRVAGKDLAKIHGENLQNNILLHRECVFKGLLVPGWIIWP